MVDITIYSKNGTEKAVVKTLEYDGTFMGDRYVTVSVSSPTVIDWAIGDYLEYRGERWSLWLLPATSKVARVSTYGGAIEYKDIRFSPTEEELRRCSFLDVVLQDNEIHYTSLPNFSFYCATAKDLADRIQANLDRLYPGQWTIIANPAASITDQSLTFSNNSCWEALAVANTTLGLNFIIDSVNRQITIGGEGAFIETQMEYGFGKGLKSVERTIDDNQQVINRLYAYGNTRNLPYRFYNKRYPEGSSVFDMVQSMYLPNLMLPGICRGWRTADAVNYLDDNGCVYKDYGAEGQELTYDQSIHWYKNPDGSDYEGTIYTLWKHYSLSEDRAMYYCDRVWIESNDSVKKCGVQEGVKFFDGSDDLVDDIYPSITGFSSTEALAEALGDEEAAAQNLTYEQGVLDEILSATVDSWDGIIPEEQETTPTFYIRIKNIGFDLSDAELDASGDTPRLSMKSGMCTGREFNILECKKQVSVNGSWRDYDPNNPVSGPWSYSLKCEVAADDSIGQYFPNDNFRLSSGDRFVILGIKMPDVYVDVAENRLLKAAIVWLSENDKTGYNYSPAINNIYMAENPETSALLKEGNVLHIYDEDLDIDVEMTISQFKIKNDKQIPEYEVTLSNDKEADLVQRVTAQVHQSYTQFIGGKGEGGSSIYLIGTNSGASPTDNNAFSARRSLRMFLRKDVNDTAAGKITFEGGTDTKESADFSDERGFLSGWLGYGARISGSGTAEFESVDVRGALRAAELVFNQIRAEDGESIRSIGYGEILTVTPDVGARGQILNTGTATLKLDGNEWATIDTEDICRGLYNTIAKDYDNSNGDTVDANGFRGKAGFFSSYFEITSVTSSKGSCEFTYQLQESNGVATCEHPCPLMKFVAYGNFNRGNLESKKKRQSCIYTTAVGISPRKLFLAGVKTFDIKPQYIKIAEGNIEGVVVLEDNNGTPVQKTLHGDAGFFCEDNIYLGGIIDQFTAAAWDIINQSGNRSAYIDSNIDQIVVDCDSDGYVTDDALFNINARLALGNATLAITTSIFRYNGVTDNTDHDEVSYVTKQYSWQRGEFLQSGVIEATLEGDDQDGNTWVGRKSISVISNRKGESVPGSSGRGIQSIASYYLITSYASGVTNTNGAWGNWSNVYSMPTAAKPYLWKYTLYSYTDNTTYKTDAELVYTFTNEVNENLLDDTAFLDLEVSDAWDLKGEYRLPSGVTIDDLPPLTHDVSTIDGYMGHKAFRLEFAGYQGNPVTIDGTEYKGENGYIEYLRQPIYAVNGKTKKTEAGSWYTLSFWLYGVIDNTNYNHSSKAYYVDLLLPTTIAVRGETIVDGVKTSNTTIHFSPTQTWTRHTVTFKTPATISADQYIQFQAYDRFYTQDTRLCMPKLEKGIIATDYANGMVSHEPIVRTTIWEENKEYFRGASGENYIDIVNYGGKWFQCRQSHISTTGNAPTIGSQNEYWRQASNFDFLSTGVLLAQEGYINNLVATILRTGSYPNPHVELESGRVAFYGALDTPSIEIVTDTNGNAHFRFYHSDGSFAYDLGPETITQNVDTVDDKFFPTQHIATTSNSTIFDFILISNSYVDEPIRNPNMLRAPSPQLGGKSITSLPNGSCDTLYKFVEGYVTVGDHKEYNVSGSSTPSAFHLKFFTQQSASISNYATGWYARQIITHAGTASDGTNVRGIVFDYYISGGITKTVTVYFKESDAFNGRDRCYNTSEISYNTQYYTNVLDCVQSLATQ